MLYKVFVKVNIKARNKIVLVKKISSDSVISSFYKYFFLAEIFNFLLFHPYMH